MGVPGTPGFRFDVGKSHAGRRIGNADEVLAGRALNLSPGKLRFALQRLITVAAVEFKFIGAHSSHSIHAQTRTEKYIAF